MRVSEKFALIDKVGRELQSRFTYVDIDAFLAEFGIKPAGPANEYNSKWVYSKAALQGVTNDTLFRIADELDIAVPRGHVLSSAVPKNWETTSAFRLFISHISKDKEKATRLKDCLSPHAISGFVAHEDIHPTLEWQREVERALHAMDAFVAILTPGFSKSVWTQQEIGFAVGRGVKIISIKMGEDPLGFISHQQALPRRERRAEEIAKEIDAILSADNQTSDKLLRAKEVARMLTSKDEIPF
jgi:TIR domain